MTVRAPARSRRKLLVVDDEPLVRQSLEYCLEDSYDVTSVGSGEEAIVASQREDFPVVILDLCMQGLSGLETLKRLREIRETQNIIILTAYQSMESAITALNLGAFNYLTKPFDRANLKEVIARGFGVYDQQIYRSRDLRHRLMSVHDTFFSLLCHEFNTPLNVILGFGEMLADHVTDPELRSWVEEIKKSGHHLHEVLMEIVDYIGVSSLADAGMDRDFQLAPMFSDIAAAFRDQEVEVVSPDTPLLNWALHGPAHSLQVITRKLVRMASHRSSRIFLNVQLESLDASGSGRLRVEVTGTGLSRKHLEGRDLEQLFQPYQFTIDDGSGQRASLGLELATCRKIAEYADGSVSGFFNSRGELGFATEVSVKLASGGTKTDGTSDAGTA
jgi:Response regulator containing CheY-like receiver, AAA-type ATPase, and DNA-binding domains